MSDRPDLGLDVSRETLERLETYVGLIRRWSPRINLVAKSTLGDVWTRHILDSIEVFRAAPTGMRLWSDLGSGGGLPGAVVAILAAELSPNMRVTMIESDQRKAVFLRTIVRECGLDASVIAERIEAVPPLGADVLSARALAPLPVLLDLAARHLAPGGICIFPKGATYAGEVKAALENWSFRCEDIPSRTSGEGVILRIGELKRV